MESPTTVWSAKPGRIRMRLIWCMLPACPYPGQFVMVSPPLLRYLLAFTCDARNRFVNSRRWRVE